MVVKNRAEAELASVRVFEASAISALVATAPAVATFVYAGVVAFGSGSALRGGGWTAILLLSAFALAVLGAVVGWLAALAAKNSRSPLRVGVSSALALYAGVMVGLFFTPMGFHVSLEWYALPINLGGGALLGPLVLILKYRLSNDAADDEPYLPYTGFQRAKKGLLAAMGLCSLLALLGVRVARAERTSTSIKQARDRGVLLHVLTPSSSVVSAEGGSSGSLTPVHIEEAWTEKVFLGRPFGQHERFVFSRVVVRLRQGEPRLTLLILDGAGKPAYLSSSPRHELLTELVREPPTERLTFITRSELNAIRDSLVKARVDSTRTGARD